MPPAKGPNRTIQIQALADAADAEGLWCKDLIKFTAVVKRHNLNFVITELMCKQAEELRRQAFDRVRVSLVSSVPKGFQDEYSKENVQQNQPTRLSPPSKVRRKTT